MNSGKIDISKFEQKNSYALFNETCGEINVSGGNIISYMYGIYNNSEGIIHVSGGNIETVNTHYVKFSKAVYIKSEKAIVIFEGGKLRSYETGIYVPLGMKIKNGGEYEKGFVNLPSGKYIAYQKESYGYVVNYLENGSTVELQKPDGTFQNYCSMYEAIENVVADNSLYKIKLINNEFLYERIEISEGKNIEIDLNSKKIAANTATSISILCKGRLKIYDNDSNKLGTINSK